MFPTFRNRILIAVAAIVGGMVWARAADWLRAADGTEGVSLLSAGCGPLLALVWLVLLGLPVIVMGVLTSSSGNPASGVFVAAVALCALGGSGGSIDGWLHRSDASLPGDYWLLALETLMWFGGMLGLLLIGLRVRRGLRHRMAFLRTQPHCGDAFRAALPDATALVSAAVTALVGGTLAYFLIRTSDTGQVNGALIVAFSLAALLGTFVAAQIFQQRHVNPIGMILSPALVAIVAYALAAIGYADGRTLLAAYFAGEVNGLALALPIHYASAGVVGASFGVGWAQVLLHEDETEGELVQPEPESA